MTTTTHATCSQCEREVRISEPYAFGGMDRLRMSLSCGHVVPRDEAARKRIALAEARVRAALANS